MVHQNKNKIVIKTIKYFSFFLLVAMISATMGGCGGSKRLAGEEEFQPEPFNQFFNHLSALEMRGRLKVSVEGNGATYSAGTTVRVAGDSIWMIGKFIGIEVFRAMVTRESGIQVINRTDKTYLTASWDEIQTKYKSRDLNFMTFRNLILGNPFLVSGVQYKFYNNKQNKVLEYDYDSGDSQLLIDLLFRKKLSQSMWVLENDQIAIEANYDRYDSPTLRNIPYFRNYIAYFHNTQPISIELEIKNFSFDDQISLPFTIPDRYTRTSLLSL